MQRKRKVDQTFLMRLGWVFLGIALLGGCATPKTETPPVTGPLRLRLLPWKLEHLPTFVAVIGAGGRYLSLRLRRNT